MDYGHPAPLTQDERAWLVQLDDDLWTRMRERKMNHAFEKRVMTPEEKEKVLGLIHAKCLPCELGSGPYGNLFLVVYDHSELPGVPAEMVAVFGDGHFPETAKTTFATWLTSWEFFSALTHSEKNREMLAFYGLDVPKSMSHYEY